MRSPTIGPVAKAENVGIDTVRFCEREGFAPKPARRRSGGRPYPPDTVRRRRFIRCAKELAFAPKEIGERFDLRVDPRRICDDVRASAKATIADVDAKMGDLERIQAALTDLVPTRRGKGPTSECPMLNALEEQGGSRDDR